MRRVLLGPAAATVLAVAGCAATVVTPSSSTVELTSPSSAPSATPTTSGPTFLPSAAPIGAPTEYHGSGDATVAITKPAGATTVIATIAGGAAGRHFGVHALDGAREHLVETEGLYQGSVVLDGDGGTTTQLYVFSRGPWSITLSDPRTAQAFDQAQSGSGDTVFLYQGPGGSALVSGGAAGTQFQIRAFGAGEMEGTLLEATGPYSGQLRWPGGVGLVSVRAVGPWSISMG